MKEDKIVVAVVTVIMCVLVLSRLGMIRLPSLKGEATENNTQNQVQVEDRTDVCTANTSRFKDSGDGTITDRETGLVWQQFDCGSPMSQEDALAHIKNSRDGGYEDWRLPTYEELLELYGGLGSGGKNHRVEPFQWTYVEDKGMYGPEYRSSSKGIFGTLRTLDFLDKSSNAASGGRMCLVRAVRNPK
jgi:hypothetical protein